MVQKIDVAVISGGISGGEKRVSRVLLAKGSRAKPNFCYSDDIKFCLRRQTRNSKHSINSITSIANIDS